MSASLRASRPAPVQPGPASLTVRTANGPIEVTLCRRKGQKRLNLSVGARGARLTAPLQANPATLQLFLDHHAPWLAKNLADLQAKTAAHALTLVPFETTHLPANGQRWPVTWEEHPTPSVAFDGAHWTFRLPRTSRAQKIAQGLLRLQWESIVRHGLAGDLGICTAAIGRAPTRVDIKPVHSMWGRLSGKDHVLLDLALALAPPQARRYVWIHELCHLAERNHSSRFWAWVDRFCPDWKAHEHWLKHNGAAIKAQVAGLLAA